MPKKSVLDALKSSDLNSYITNKIQVFNKSDSVEFQLPPPVNDAETTFDSYLKHASPPNKLATLKFSAKNTPLDEHITRQNQTPELKQKKLAQPTDDFNQELFPSKHQTPPVKVRKIQKEVKLRDFESLERMSQTDLDSIGLQYLQKLYMIQPTNKSSLLYRLQRSHDSNFDGSGYTDTMLRVMLDCYHLPNHPTFKRYNVDDKEKLTTEQPYDELFIWSLMLYGGIDEDLRLPRFFWSRAKYPIACCLAAIIIYQNLKLENLIPDYLKEEMDVAIK
jgi:hypothetical protein